MEEDTFDISISWRGLSGGRMVKSKDMSPGYIILEWAAGSLNAGRRRNGGARCILR